MTLAFFMVQVLHSLRHCAVDFSSGEALEPLMVALPLLFNETLDAIDFSFSFFSCGCDGVSNCKPKTKTLQVSGDYMYLIETVLLMSQRV
jgi:hypothetical protein